MILIRDIKNATVHFASWCIVASGFGMLTASVLFTKIKLGEKLITLKISPAILGLGCIMVSTGTGWPIGIIEAVYPCVFFLMGFSFTMAAIPFDVLVQKKTPETHTGRVFGTINSLSTLAVLVGILLGGSLSEWFGVRLAFLISGGATCLLAAVSAIAMKKAERKEIHVAEGLKTTS
ncbi:MFS transporter [Heyndrickxia faecalis]|uniref:MFS transporter n=1 Tax=Heyndrickxia faecalis TaxID=2824910 RepID=UPI003100E8D3